MKEIFKDVKGYEGQYQVSNLGNVYSTPKDGKPNKMLKQEVSKRSCTNYRRVTLSKEGKTKRFQVHRLVAQTFIPNTEEKPYVNHIDNNGENNSVSNLEWVTHSENMQHSAKQGRQDNVKSKGGIASGEILRKKKLAKVESMVGKTFGNLLVVGVDQQLHRKNPRNVLICKCSCGNTNTVKRYPYELVGNKIPKHCAECAQKLRRNNEI